MIKYNASETVISYYNPIISLNSEIRKTVNENFIVPILRSFFTKYGGISCFEELEPDKLITEVDFINHNLFSSLVKQYLYNEIITNISKSPEGIVDFKPRYIITFDEDLAELVSGDAVYPHKPEKSIKYGVMKLGAVPILYYVYVNFQELTRYIKTLSHSSRPISVSKVQESNEQKRNRLVDQIILKKQTHIEALTNEREIQLVSEEIERLSTIKKQKLEGASGNLRVNLAWNTTDDLDLSIETPSGEIISYQNKTVEYSGILGELDVDRNADFDITSTPQENINWDGFPKGLHRIFVNFYNMREKTTVPFTLSIISQNSDSRVYNDFVEHTGISQCKEIATFELVNNEYVFTKH